jgi:hypothetical protein
MVYHNLGTPLVCIVIGRPQGQSFPEPTKLSQTGMAETLNIMDPKLGGAKHDRPSMLRIHLEYADYSMQAT